MARPLPVNFRISSFMAVGIVLLTALSLDACMFFRPHASAVQTYAFTGTVESINPATSSAAKIGDRVAGSFIIDHTAVVIPLNDKHVSYRFASGTPLVFAVNAIKFSADASSFPCMASVADNELSGDKPIDTFKLTCTDQALQSSLGLAFLAASLNLSDSSGAVFSGTGLPTEVNLQKFDNALLSVVGTQLCKKGEKCNELVFDILMRINSAVKQ
jgi:hypothetical protein